MSGCALCFPVNNVEAMRANWMPCRAGVMMNGGGGPEVLIEPVPKSSASLSYILNWTVGGCAFVLVNDSTFL